jgi:polyphenol oxidase
MPSARRRTKRTTKRSRINTKAPKSRSPKKNPNSSGWRERKTNGLVIIEANSFASQKWLVHGFSTRLGGASELKLAGPPPRREKVLNLGFVDWDTSNHVEENRRKFIHAFGAGPLTLVPLRQFHSDAIQVVDTPPSTPLSGDALITSTPALLLAVQTADCIPILLADLKRRVVAAIHAGWRGTLKRIVEKTIGRMRMLFDSDPLDILAALGPGIRQCCFEVGPEVVKEYASQFDRAREWFDGPFEQLTSGEDPNPLPWLNMRPPGHQPPEPRCQLDLHAVNRYILENAGVPAVNITTMDLCTSSRTDLLFSYRREKPTGRLMAAIAIRP